MMIQREVIYGKKSLSMHVAQTVNMRNVKTQNNIMQIQISKSLARFKAGTVKVLVPEYVIK